MKSQLEGSLDPVGREQTGVTAPAAGVERVPRAQAGGEFGPVTAVVPSDADRGTPPPTHPLTPQLAAR